MKVELYPYKDESFKMYALDDGSNPYNLSISDVDFSATPEIKECSGFVNGTVTHFIKKPEFRLNPFTGEYYETYRTEERKVECLMAVIDFGKIGFMEIPAYRVRSLSEK